MFNLFSKGKPSKFKDSTPSYKEKYEEMQRKNIIQTNLFELSKVGIEFEESGDIDSAIRVYEDIIDAEWDGRDVYNRLSDIYIQKGMNENAIRVLQKYIDICSDKNSHHVQSFKNKINKLQAPS